MRFDRAAFLLDDRPIALGRVLSHARIAGLLDPVERRLSEQLAAAARAEEDGVEVDEAAFQACFDEWRGSLDLYSSAETEAWLARHGIELDQVSLHVETALLARALEPDARAEALLAAPPDPALVGERLAVAAAMEGALPGLAAAVAARMTAPPPADARALAGERRALRAERGLESDLALVSAGEPFATSPEELARILDREAAHRLRVRSAATDEALRRELERRRGDLVRVTLAAALFDAEDAAREALLCIRDDGASLAGAAALAGARYSEDRPLLGDLTQGPLAARLRSAREGDVLGPFDVDGRTALYAIGPRTQPTLADPEVGARLRAAILERVVAPDVARRVRFPVEMSVPA